MFIEKADDKLGTVYVHLGKIALIFRHGVYHGWYHPLLDRVV